MVGAAEVAEAVVAVVAVVANDIKSVGIVIVGEGRVDLRYL